jgi:hypothetical protein
MAGLHGEVTLAESTTAHEAMPFQQEEQTV